MKKLVSLSVLALVCATAGPITSAEREKAIRHLNETRAAFLASIQGLSATQWAFKPAPEVWSVAEVAEHITVSEATIMDLIQKKVLAAPADPAKAAETKGKDEQVLQMIPDRSEKFKAPEFLHPKARWTQAELPGQFGTLRDKTIEFVRATQEDLRGHSGPHPVLKTLDAYQWVLLISAHSQRHTAQIEEVKSHANFPKSLATRTLSPAEREKAIQHLEKTRSGFLAAIQGLTPDQWNFKPAADVWSVAEVAEHITVSEASILELVEKKILGMPANPEQIRAAQGNDERVLAMQADRSQKFKAPEVLHPKARWSQAELAAEFNARRDKTVEFVRTTQQDLRSHTHAFPVVKALDAYQFVLVSSGHSQRHTAQIEEVKAHANFPKSARTSTLAPAERDQAISHLEKSRATFLAAIGGLSAEQWGFKPAPEVWSVGEVAEHITLSEGSLMDLVQLKVLKTEANPEMAEKTRGNDDALLSRIEDRSRKGQAPEFLQPKASWSQAALPGEFNTRRSRTLEFIRSTQEDLRAHQLGVQPGASPLDAYQYVLLISAHTLRHSAQIAEVKAHPNFPKK